jgi:thiosulfate/3-mercaptopyruvate sulfurtransferase
MTGDNPQHPNGVTMSRIVGWVLLGVVLMSGASGAQQNPREPLLVSPQWLNDHLNDRNLVILHVGDPEKFPAGHIPGARLMDLLDISQGDTTGFGEIKKRFPSATLPKFIGPQNGLGLEMLAPDLLRTQLESFGISDDSKIVVYEEGQWVSPATRVVFTLDYAGLGGRTVLLDGGFTAWKAANNAVSTDVSVATKPGTLSALKIRPLIVDAEYMNANGHKAGVSLVDARSINFYNGVPPTSSNGGPPRRLGHIPGAKSIPFNSLSDSTGRLKAAGDLRDIFTKAGVQAGDTVVAYCHVGQQATAVLFAARSLGHPVKLFDGSWDAWNKRTEFPVEVPTKTP